jgi:hypothetical protein
LEVKTYPGNVTGRRGNVTMCFLPDLLQIINEKINTPKRLCCLDYRLVYLLN